MTCTEAITSLAGSLAGSPLDRELETHVLACASCRARRADLARIRAALRQSQGAARLSADVRARLEATFGSRPRPGFGRAAPIAAGLVAAAALALFWPAAAERVETSGGEAFLVRAGQRTPVREVIALLPGDRVEATKGATTVHVDGAALRLSSPAALSLTRPLEIESGRVEAAVRAPLTIAVAGTRVEMDDGEYRIAVSPEGDAHKETIMRRGTKWAIGAGVVATVATLAVLRGTARVDAAGGRELLGSGEQLTLTAPAAVATPAREQALALENARLRQENARLRAGQDKADAEAAKASPHGPRLAIAGEGGWTAQGGHAMPGAVAMSDEERRLLKDASARARREMRQPLAELYREQKGTTPPAELGSEELTSELLASLGPTDLLDAAGRQLEPGDGGIARATAADRLFSLLRDQNRRTRDALAAQVGADRAREMVPEQPAVRAAVMVPEPGSPPLPARTPAP